MTYVWLVMFTVEPGMQATVESIVVNEMIPRIKARKGFKDIHFMGDEETGEYCEIIHWESKEDAEAAKEALLPILEQKIGGIAKGRPVTKLYEMYEPRGQVSQLSG